jgi:glycine amidinotransferase/scyllo-inosamine-4-phosphate amidinotransferase 1
MVSVKNEWGKLKEVFVGTIDNANMPKHGVDLHCINYADKDVIPSNELGFFDDKVYEETHEDLESLVRILEDCGVNVKRPKPINTTSSISNGFWETDQYYTFCPRDTVTVIGDTIIEAPMTLRSRQFETYSFREDFIKYMEQGARWVAAPKPMLKDDLYQRKDLSKLTLTEKEPVFDAANILRSNNDILYLVSNTGNKLGAKWLQNLLGTEYKVHVLENMYSYSHLDSTIALLREGLCLLNPARINENNMPEMLKSWDKIWSPDMVDIGYHKVERASVWVGINLLSVDENTVILDNRQTELIKELKKYNIDTLDCKIRHSRTLGGSFHCVTTETLRD